MIKQKFLMCSAIVVFSVAGTAVSQSPTPSPSPSPSPSPKECDIGFSRGVDTDAIILAKPEPNFSKQERERYAGQAITLRATLCGSGKVTDIRLREGLTNEMNAAAIEAARLIRFTPAEKDGKKVSRVVTLKYFVRN